MRTSASGPGIKATSCQIATPATTEVWRKTQEAKKRGKGRESGLSKKAKILNRTKKQPMS